MAKPTVKAKQPTTVYVVFDADGNIEAAYSNLDTVYSISSKSSVGLYELKKVGNVQTKRTFTVDESIVWGA